MKTVFLKVLFMSADACWLILAVLVLRLLLKKAPKAIHCALWALVAIRLVCPFTLESALSVMPSVQAEPGQLITNFVPPEPMPADPVPTTEPVETAPGEAVPMERPTDPVAVAGFIWLLGIAALGTYAGASVLRLRRRLREAVVWENNIRLCDQIDTPFIFGVFRPRIYLPTTLNRDQTDFVLAHERAHLRRRDHWWKPLGFLLLTVYWFNPLSWLAYWLLCRDIELACDERVVKDMEAADKKAYSLALLTCGVRHTAIAACPLAFGEVGVKQRVKHVLSYKKPTFWIIIVAILVCIAVAVGFLTDPLVIRREDVDGIRIGKADGIGEEGTLLSEEDEALLLNLINDSGKTPFRAGKDEGSSFASVQIVIGCKDGSAYLLHYWYKSGFSFHPAHFGEDDYDCILTHLDVEGSVKRAWKLEEASEALFSDWWYEWIAAQRTESELTEAPTEPEEEPLWPMEEEETPSSAEYFSQVRGLDWSKAAHPIPAPYGVRYAGSEEAGELQLTRDGEVVRTLPTTPISWPLGSDARWYYAASADRTKLFRVDYEDGREEVLFTDPTGCLFAGTYIDHTLYFVASVSEETLGIYRLYVPDGNLTLLYDQIPNIFTPGMWRNPISLTPVSTVEMEWSYEPDRLNGRRYFACNTETGAYVEGDTPVHLTAPDQYDLETLLQTIAMEQTPATLTLIQNGEEKTYPAWGCGNDKYISRVIANLNGMDGADYRYVATGDLLFDHDLEGSILLEADDGSWTLTFRQGDSWVSLTRNGETRWYEAQPLAQHEELVGNLMRLWFDEAEFWGLEADYRQQGSIVIPDRGQGYLEAAQEYCQKFEELKLLPSPGSSLRMIYVSCTVNEDEAMQATTSMRERGEIGENTWCFWLNTVFVPENEAAYSNYQAGNTMEYTGDDPNVPEGAYQYSRCGYITLEEDGWHGELVGTGW